MKTCDKITVMLIMAMILSVPLAYAGGPGFQKDVYTWGGGGSNDDDNSGGDDDNYNCDDDNNYEVPLDGGLGFLAAAGALYGIKRIRDNRKKEE